MSEHTPTPWAHRDGIIHEESNKWHFLPINSPFVEEAFEVGKEGHKNAVANAAFIVLACNNHDRLTRENEAMRKALEPFSQTGWMTSDTEHTARTIVVHMHPESEREIILSSDDFRRAAAAIASLKENDNAQP